MRNGINAAKYIRGVVSANNGQTTGVSLHDSVNFHQSNISCSNPLQRTGQLIESALSKIEVSSNLCPA
jgi:hypothetical protein